jgi:porin
VFRKPSLILALPIAWTALLCAPSVGASPLERLSGIRQDLAARGIAFRLFLNHYTGWIARGPESFGDEVGHSGSYDAFARIDLEELVGWTNFDVLLHLKGQYDRSLNPDLPSLSNPIDDADFDEPIYVDELWLQRSFFDDRALLRIGFLEQQTMFDRNAYANSEDRQFATTFLDNDAVVPLPNALGAVLLVKPLDWLELAFSAADADNESRSAGFDSAFDGVSSLSGYFEAALHAEIPGPTRTLEGTYRFGVFSDGRKLARFDRDRQTGGAPRTERGHVGAYASLDQALFFESANDAQGLGLFARFGYADEDANRIAWFWSAGLQYIGLVPGRNRDVTGMAVYQAIGSKRYRSAVDSNVDDETGFELYYRAELTPWLAITPDIQYTIDPGAIRSTRDAWVVLVRLRAAF